MHMMKLVPWQWKYLRFYFYFLKQVFGLCKEKLEKGVHMAQKSGTKDPKVDKHWAHNFYVVTTSW